MQGRIQVDAGGGGGGYSLFQAATPFWGLFNLQNIYFSLAPRLTDTNPLSRETDMRDHKSYHRNKSVYGLWTQLGHMAQDTHTPNWRKPFPFNWVISGFSLSFPGLENWTLIFKVSPDFQSGWEPCLWGGGGGGGVRPLQKSARY